MRRISLAIALVGAFAVAGCGGAGSNSSSGKDQHKGVDGTKFTLSIRGEFAFVDPTSGTTTILPGGGYVQGASGLIDCGYLGTTVKPMQAALAHTKCDAALVYGTALDPLTVVTKDVSGATWGNTVWAWAGACSGIDPCKPTIDSDKLVAIRLATEMKGIGSHPNFSNPAVHGAEFAAGRQWPCKDCHGDQLQGAGLAIGCIACHTTQQVAAMNAYYDTAVPVTGPVEQCASCHPWSTGPLTHTLDDWNGVSASIVSQPSVSGSDIQYTVNIKVNGVNRDDFTAKQSTISNHNEDQFWIYSVPTTAVDRNKLSPQGNFTITSQGNGNYLISLTGLATKTTSYGYPATTPGMGYVVTVASTQSGAAISLPAYMGGAPNYQIVSDAACNNCHGLFPRGTLIHDASRPVGVGQCRSCHSRIGGEDPRIGGKGAGLMGIVHGIHNSENMPDGVYTMTWPSNGNKFNFSIGFPTYMNNCSICHDSPANLAAATSAPVSYALCFSCHDDFSAFPSAPSFHASWVSTTAPSCATSGCHAGETVNDFHNGSLTARSGLIWGGQDVSVVEGAKFNVQVGGVAWEPGSSTTYIVSWTATYNGAAVNPCNLDFTVGPVFLSTVANAATGQAVHNMSIIREYAVGNDWVIGKSTSSPGQPASVTLYTASQFDSKGNPYTLAQNGFTACSGNTAQTHLKAETGTGATRGVIGLQGKPAIRYAPAVGTATEITQVRAKSPVYEFNPSTLAASGTTRRAITDTAKCLKCHPGSLYQHGGNRVDNVELCVLCHNPASSEEQNRVAYGVTPAEAYDGKVGQTYDLRTMLHAVHSAGETGKLLVYYRSNGVYAFGSTATIATIPNWKTTPNITCSGLVEGRPSPVAQYMIFGSTVGTGSKETVQVATVGGPGTALTLDPTGACSSLSVLALPSGYTKGVYRTFNEIPVEYPRALNDCSVCHVAGFNILTFPDPKQAVAVSDSDIGDVTNIGNLLDDVLTGASTQSCFTCHQSSDPTVDAQLKQHGYNYGWTPKAFPGGRQDIINAAP